MNEKYTVKNEKDHLSSRHNLETEVDEGTILRRSKFISQ